MDKVLSGQVALVTGGSRGIGRAVCVALASQGAFVFVNYASRKEAADETVAACRAAGGDGAAVGFDVGVSSQVDEAFERIKSEKQKIDILVNNAGVTYNGLLLRLKDEDWERTIRTNLTGTLYCSRAAAKLMVRSRYGRIVNLSSVVAEMGNEGQAPYVAAKAGVIGLTKSMARELSSRGITVNSITPGFIETDMTSELPEAAKGEYMNKIPLGRFGSAADVAAAVSFLSSPGAGYITGQVLGVNGGLYM